MIRVKRKTLVRITRFFMAIIICLLMAFGLRAMWKEKTVSQHSRKTFGVVIDLDQREKLFDQLKRFADINDFDIHIGPTTSAGVTFNIYMSRKDVIVIANNVLQPKGYDFDFYDKDPDHPVSEDILDSLMSDLKRFIIEVPNVRIFD
jgi:hypothetical protein